MHFPTHKHNSFVVCPYVFSAIRVFDKTLVPTDIMLKISVSASQTLTEENREEKVEEGFKKLAFWTEAVLGNVIMIDVASEKFGDIATGINNTVMFVPGEPTDHLLVQLLHNKIVTITKGLFDVHSVSLTTSDTNNFETHFRSDGGYDLPGLEYFPGEVIHPVPWWQRPTIEVCEFPKGIDLGDKLMNEFADYMSMDGSELDGTEADIIVLDDNENR